MIMSKEFNDHVDCHGYLTRDEQHVAGVGRLVDLRGEHGGEGARELGEVRRHGPVLK